MRLICVLALIFIFAGCNKSVRKNFQIDSLKTYGLHNDLNFSDIADIIYDNNLLYIADGQLLKLKAINTNNQVVKSYSFKRGRGPGEFTFMMGPFEVFKDSLLFFIDEREIEKFSYNGVYLNTFKFPFKLYGIESVKDSVLLLNAVNEGKNILYVMNSEGMLVDSIAIPFEAEDFQFGFPAIWHVSDDNYVYLASPFETRIVKMDLQGKIIWDYRDKNARFVNIPEFHQKGKTVGIYQTKGWTSLWEDSQYIYGSTFNVTEQNAEKAVIVLDKQSGNLQTIVNTTEYIYMKSFFNGKKIYRKTIDPENGIYVAEVIIKWE